MNIHQRYRFIFSFSAAVLLASCASNEIGQSKDVNPETIYQQYRLEYNENEKNAEMIALFRFAGENGTTLVLTGPSKFEYDSNVVKVDSSSFGGAFYKATTPEEKIIGKHTLLFEDIDKKKYENIFSVDSFGVTDVPQSVSRLVPALIKFNAPVLQGEDYIELSSDGTDSSFTIKQVAGEKGDYITIPVELLQRQKKSEFFLIATLYRKFNLRNQTKEGGAITTTQTLKPIKIQLKEEAL